MLMVLFVRIDPKSFEKCFRFSGDELCNPLFNTFWEVNIRQSTLCGPREVPWYIQGEWMTVYLALYPFQDTRKPENWVLSRKWMCHQPGFALIKDKSRRKQPATAYPILQHSATWAIQYESSLQSTDDETPKSIIKIDIEIASAPETCMTTR